jgi:hypothetical protein
MCKSHEWGLIDGCLLDGSDDQEDGLIRGFVGRGKFPEDAHISVGRTFRVRAEFQRLPFGV